MWNRQREAFLCLFDTALSCPCRRCELNWRQVKTVFSCLEVRCEPSFVLSRPSFLKFATVTVQAQIYRDYWNLSWLVANSVHTIETDMTRQCCLVRVGGVNWALERTKIVFRFPARTLRGSVRCYFRPSNRPTRDNPPHSLPNRRLWRLSLGASVCAPSHHILVTPPNEVVISPVGFDWKLKL